MAIYSGRTVSVKNVIAKVYRDLDLREEDNFINFIEWSAEALEKIGAFTQLESKHYNVPISNYRGELPDDLVYLTPVTYRNYPILPTSNAIDPIKIDTQSSSTAPYAFYQNKIKNKVFVDDAGFIDNNTAVKFDNITYKISNGCIKTSVENGILEIVYEAMPIDCDGYPLVPDYVEFKEAVYWYINMKYTYSGWRRGEIRDGVYQDTEKNWHWYCQQAANKAMIPDLGKLENIKRSYLSLRPRTEQFKKFYDTLNETPPYFY